MITTTLDPAAFALWLEAQGERRFSWTGFGSASHPLAQFLRDTTGREWLIGPRGLYIYDRAWAPGEPSRHLPEPLPMWADCFADWYDHADIPTARECLDVLQSFSEPRAPRRVEGQVRRMSADSFAQEEC